jgi:hypothetical protein
MDLHQWSLYRIRRSGGTKAPIQLAFKQDSSLRNHGLSQVPRSQFSKIKKSLIGRFRRLAWRILGPAVGRSQGYIGQHGCIRCAASFLAWNQIDGDYLEFGVYRGSSFAEAYRAIWSVRDVVRDFIDNEEVDEWYGRRPKFVAFDSFAGLPGGDTDRHEDYGEGAYSCSEAEFLRNIKNRGVNLNDVLTLPGFYNETLTPEAKQRLNIRRASLVLIDCDLYESTVSVLNFLTDLLQQGTIIIFDDWYRYKGRPDKGEQRACREWLENNPHIELVQYWQQGPQAVSFLVNLRDSHSEQKFA